MTEARAPAGMAGVVAVRLALMGLWFGGLSILASHLGQDDFGIYGLAVAFIQLFASIIGDTLDLAVLRRFPDEHERDPDSANALFRVAFGIRIAIGVTVFLVTSAASVSIAEHFFDDPDRWPLAMLAGAGVLTDALGRAAFVYFQGISRFRSLLKLDALLQGGRFAGIGALLLAGHLGAFEAVALYVLAPVLVLIAGLAMMPRALLRGTGASNTRQHLSDALRYSKWMILAMGVASFSERLELFLVAYFLTVAEAGVYFTALILAARLPELLEGAMATVFMPQVSQSRTAGTYRKLFLAYAKKAVLPALLVLAGTYWLGEWAITTFFSIKYTATVPLVKLMMVGAMTWLATAPLAAAAVAFISPVRLLQINVAGLILRAALGVTLIPTYGLMGAASIFLVLKLAMTLAVTLSAWQLSRSRELPLRPAAP